ncbi:MAG: nucleotidyltransferase family protein [bacterium]
MQAVILAAGKGTRMQQLTKQIPKPMISVYERPLLAHKIEMLPDAITEVIIIIGYLGYKIIEYFGSSYAGKSITYVYQETLNGTGGALHYAIDLLQDPFLVLMGDDLYLKNDLEKLLEHEFALLAYEHSDPRQFGLVSIDKNNHLIDVLEKPIEQKPGFINTGAYMLTPRFFEYCPVQINQNEYGLPQTLAHIGKTIPVHVVKAQSWHPVTSPEDIFKAGYLLRSFLQ